jgi:hypothetical protein
MTSELTASQKLAEVLNHECPEEQIGRVLRECLTATVTDRSGVTSPDFKTRLAAAPFVTTQRHGLPVRREEIIQVNVDADNATGMKSRLAHSPALRALLRGMLDEVDRSLSIDT